MIERFWLCAWVVAAGCAGPPPVHDWSAGIELPPAWEAAGAEGASAPTGADSTGAWWAALGGERIDALVGEALRNAPSLEAAAARIDAARALVRSAGAAAWPQLNAAGSAARSKRSFIGFPSFGPAPVASDEPLSVESTSYSTALDLSWEVDLWGRIRSGRSAALADAEAAEALLSAARNSLVAQVCKAFFAVAEAEQQLELARATAANRAEMLERIESRYRRGLRGALEVHRARTEGASAKARRVAAVSRLQTARRQLEVLLGRYPSGSIRAGDLPAPPRCPPAGLPADLLARRPDLVAAERTLAASDRRLAEARRGLYPRISLTGSAGTSSDQLADLADSGFGIWSVGATLVQPLFQGGRIAAGIDLADAVLRESLAHFGDALLRACAEVEGALDAEARLAEQVAALTEAAQAAAAAHVLAESRYTGGLTDALVLLDAQRASYDAHSRLIEVRRARLDQRVNLHLALGGAFDQDETRKRS